jgi:alanyl-tRNA synthetase
LTRKLYWEDPYCQAFESRVVETTSFDGRPAVVLDATCFYPTSGGQPHDTGRLNGVPVVDVVESNGQVVHVLAEPLPTDGDMVRGEIDWERRLDHMQQHTGQHILSRAFEVELDAETVSFHLGDESSTIDLALADLDARAAERVEELANRIVMGNSPVRVSEHEGAEVQALALRKAPAVEGRIRVVRVGEFDICACGGTHVRATGEVGLIHIRRWEHQRGQVRVEFLCGGRALRDYRRQNRLLLRLAGDLTVGMDELPEAVARLGEAERAARRQTEQLRRRLLYAELSIRRAEAELVGEWRVFHRVLEGYDAGDMRYLAQRLVEWPDMIALLAVEQPSPQICFARGEQVSLDMSRLLRDALAPYGGRGGGKPHLAQGGGVSPADLQPVLERALEAVHEEQR